MGEVYKARDSRLDRTVAIKVLPTVLSADPDVTQRFEREARAIAALSHPHICALYDVGNHNGTEYLVMEHLEGETLTARLSRGALPLSESLQYAVEILDALEQAHGQGILHCDLKPSNILLTRSGTKLLDFGIAKIQGRDSVLAPGDSQSRDDTVSLKAEDVLLGTVQYMSPERLEGQPASASADLFAVGAVLFEMITGRKAFDGRDRGEILAAVLTSEPPLVSHVRPNVPPVLDRAIARCLAKAPENRWQSAHDLRLELAWIADHSADTVPPSSKTVRSGVRRAATLGLGATLVALTMVMAARSFGPATTDPSALRFVVSPPEDTTFSTAGKWLDVSPDGRWLAFSAVRPNGQSVLWLRPLDSTTARPLAGTEGGGVPFWSPNSRFLGFFAEGKLKKIDLLGGEPQTLCAVPVAFGGTWNRDGVILFGGGRGGIFRVTAAGGVATPVTRLDPAREEAVHTWPQFLPDGHRFLYRIWSSNSAYTGIYLASIDASAPPVRLVSADSNPMYASGHLLFGRDGTLFAQLFNAREAHLTGETVSVAEQVVQNRSSGQMSAAVSATGMLVYRAVGLQQLVWVDRHGGSLGPVGPAGVYRDPSLSPNGDRVAVSRFDPQTGTEDIWMIDAARSTATRLTTDPARDISPVFSPDGRRIVFISNRGGSWHVYQKALDESQAEEQLAGGVGPTSALTDWSRDGRLVLFERVTPTQPTQRQVAALPLTGDRTPVAVLNTAFDEHRGQLSPDGRWLAYESTESGTSDVYVRPFPAGKGHWQISQSGGTEPKWRGDGQELFYLAPDGTLSSVAVRTTPAFTSDLPRPLFKTALSGRLTGVTGRNRYDVTADGQRFLLLDSVGGPASSPLTVVTNWPSTLRR
jgi:serine/threonine protein kinase/Tol biopolymer transport system component